MTPAEAQSILSLCLPGDESITDVPGFDLARMLPATDARLAAWWVQEKNFDDQLCRKLATLTPPPELETTILRGGATIFYASRLIAESTEEDSVALPVTMEAPLVAKPARLSTFPGAVVDGPPTVSRRAASLYGRVAVYGAGFFVAIAFILLLVSVPNLLKNKGSHGPQLPAFLLYAAQLAEVPPLPPAPGQTMDDLRHTLDDGHAPNPPGQAILTLVPGGAVPDSVAINQWNVHPISHYVLPNGAIPNHLFILNRAEFPQDEVTPAIVESDTENYHVQTWTADGFIYVVLKPKLPKL